MSKRHELAQEDLEFLEWVSEIARSEQPPVPVPLEVRLNEMTRHPQTVDDGPEVSYLVVALVIVLVAGSLGVNLGNPNVIVGLLLVGGAFAVGVHQAKDSDSDLPEERGV